MGFAGPCLLLCDLTRVPALAALSPDGAALRGQRQAYDQALQVACITATRRPQEPAPSHSRTGSTLHAPCLNGRPKRGTSG